MHVHDCLFDGSRLDIMQLLEVLVRQVIVLESFLDAFFGQVDGDLLEQAEEFSELLSGDGVELFGVQQRPEGLEHLIVARVLAEHEEDDEEHTGAVVV